MDPSFLLANVIRSETKSLSLPGGASHRLTRDPFCYNPNSKLPQCACAPARPFCSEVLDYQATFQFCQRNPLCDLAQHRGLPPAPRSASQQDQKLQQVSPSPCIPLS